jgi:hypothetical protein
VVFVLDAPKSTLYPKPRIYSIGFCLEVTFVISILVLLSFRDRRARLVGEFHHPQMQLIEDSKSVGQE